MGARIDAYDRAANRMRLDIDKLMTAEDAANDESGVPPWGDIVSQVLRDGRRRLARKLATMARREMDAETLAFAEEAMK